MDALASVLLPNISLHLWPSSVPSAQSRDKKNYHHSPISSQSRALITLSIIAHLQWRNAFSVVIAVLVGRHAIHLLLYVGGVVHFRGVTIDFVRAVDAVQIGVTDEHLEMHA